MSYRDLIGVRENRGELLARTGAAEGAGYAAAGEGLAAGINKSTDMRFKTSEREASEAADRARQAERQDWASGEAQKVRDVEAGNARALEDAYNSTRPTAADVGASQLEDATGDAGVRKTTGTGTAGPTSPTMHKMGGFTSVDAAKDAISFITNDEERRRKNREADENVEAAARALEEANVGDPQNPLGGATGMDLARSARGGYMDDVTRVAGARRQAGYEDPIAEETLARNRGFEDVTRPLAINKAQADIRHTNMLTQTGLEPVAKPRNVSASEIAQLMAQTTGSQHEELKQLGRVRLEAEKAALNPYATQEARAEANRKLEFITGRVDQIKNEIMAVQAQWFGVLGGAYPGLNFPGMMPGGVPSIPGPGRTGGTGGIDQGAIDAEMKRRGLAPAPAPAPR